MSEVVAEKALGITLLAVLVLLISAQPIAAVTVDVVPSATSVRIDEVLTVDVMVTGLADMAAPALGAYDLQLHFDPAVFALDDVAFSSMLGQLGAAEAVGTVSPDIAGVRVFKLSLLADPDLVAMQGDEVTLFTVTFIPNELGTAVFDVTANAPLADELGVALPLDGTSSATVDVVRIPPTEIPTLSTWGSLALVLTLALVAGRILRGTYS